MGSWCGLAIRFAVSASVCLAPASCATAGEGSNPPLPGVTVASSDAAASPDDATPGDEVGEPGDAGPGPGSGSTCSDALHGLRAIFVLPPVPCSASTDCPSGDCCYVGNASTCVMQ
jgi:hypothetical protein